MSLSITVPSYAHQARVLNFRVLSYNSETNGSRSFWIQKIKFHINL